MIEYFCDRCNGKLSSFSCENGQSYNFEITDGTAEVCFESFQRRMHFCEMCGAKSLRELAAAIEAKLRKVGL